MTGTAVTTYDEKWASIAQEFMAQAPVSAGQGLSAKGGVFAMGESILGTQLCVIAVDSIWVNTYFREKWDEQNPKPPTCYAYGRSVDEMRPHHTMQADMNWFRPQNGMEYMPDGVNIQPKGCATCPMNEWGSAAQGGGKACQNRDKLALIPAGWYVQRPRSNDYDLQLADDPAHFQNQDIVKFNLPVTSVKAWRTYVQKVNEAVRRPPFGVFTRIYLERDPKVQFRVGFEMIETVPDHLAQIIINRHMGIRDTMAEAYSPPDNSPRPPQNTGRR